jgi:putative ATP-dependent endonuclease of the OLD family
MRILRCTVQNFRGFEELELLPRGHVLLVGEPRSGRSDLLSALGKVFEVEQTRLDELDFHGRDLSRDIEIEVTVGDLDVGLQQRFMDQLEFWDVAQRALIPEVDDPTALPAGAQAILRLAFRGRWDSVEERSTQVVYWAKSSDPTNDTLRRVSREDRAAFPFHRLLPGRPLNLAPRGLLRSALGATEAEALGDALREMADGIEDLSANLSESDPVVNALGATVDVLRPYVGVDAPVADVVRFLPDDGSLAALLRALQPAFDLADGAEHLPLPRHGSTTTAQVSTAEAISTATPAHAVVVVDDYGDTLDASSAQRLAALLRRASGQVWLSTRRPETARSFDTNELIRLTASRPLIGQTRRAWYGSEPSTKSERLAARELHRVVLPAMTARALIVVEGQHDAVAYDVLAERLDLESGVTPPEAYGIRVIEPGPQGGIDAVVRISELGRSLGFRTIALVDYDHDAAKAASRLAALLAAADAVVRLPHGHSIELALLNGVPDAEIITTLTELSGIYSLPLPTGWQSLTGTNLADEAVKALKSNGGLHGPFVRSLPTTVPPLATAALASAIACARGVTTDAHVQLA